MNIDDALAVRLSVYKNTWIDYDNIEKMSNEHGWEVMGFNKDMTKIYIIESPMGKELDLYIKAIEPKYIMIKDIKKKYWD